jgi:hypothetical protein
MFLVNVPIFQAHIYILLAGDVNNIQNQVQNCNTQTIINQLLQQQGQQFLQDQNSQSAMIIDNNSLTSRLTGGNQAKDATLSSLHAALTGTTTSSNKKAKDNKTGGANSTKAGGTGAKRQNLMKKMSCMFLVNVPIFQAHIYI